MGEVVLRDHQLVVLGALQRVLVEPATSVVTVGSLRELAPALGAMRPRQVRLDLEWLARAGLVEVVERCVTAYRLTAAGGAFMVGGNAQPLAARPGTGGGVVDDRGPDQGSRSTLGSGTPTRAPAPSTSST